MPRAARRALLVAATIPALAVGAATALAELSEVAAAYAAYLPVARNTYPLETNFRTEEECRQARARWWPQHEAALERLAAAPSRSLADLELKLQFALEDLKVDGGAGAVDVRPRP